MEDSHARRTLDRANVSRFVSMTVVRSLEKRACNVISGEN